jgi:hypothetical protein
MDNHTVEPWEQRNRKLANETQSLLIDLGVELVTFSNAYIIESKCEGYFKAWHKECHTLQFDSEMWGRIEDAVHWLATSNLGAEYERSHGYVIGWQVINNRVQIAAKNIYYAGGFDYEEHSFEKHSLEWNAYQEARREWGGSAEPSYRYDLTGDLPQMFAAMHWSSNTQGAASQLEHFLHHPDEFVRSSLAANPNTPEDTLVQLGYDSSIYVRNTIRMNPGIPEWLKKALAYDFEYIT